MTPTTRYHRTRLLTLVAGFSLLSALAAAAQTPPVEVEAEAPATEEAATAPDVNDADVMKDIDVSKLDWSQLNVDPSTFTGQPLKGRAGPKNTGANANWSNNAKANGSSAVSVKQSLSPLLDARVGADMTVARQGTLTNSEALSDRLSNGGNAQQSSGTAWAAITAPGVASIWDKTAVEARVDPGQDQTKLGTSLSKSVALSEQYSVTLKNDYNVIQQGVVPAPGTIGRPVRSYETDQSAQLSVNDTGTSFVAGQTLSSTDEKWLRKIGAEQKLFDGVTISGSVGETSTGAVNKSLSAGFKRSW
jgi:hypothetical protein